GVGIVETDQRLEQLGVDVVGLNCFRGPATMLPWPKEIRPAAACHVGALPMPCRTTPEERAFVHLSEPGAAGACPHGRTGPAALAPLQTSRYEIGALAKEAYDLGVNYIGVRCGATPMHIREVAEAVGLVTDASRFSENMANHFMYGDNERLADNVVALGDTA